MEMARTVSINGQSAEPGTRSIVRVPVTTRLDGSELQIPVHVVRGREDGPTLTLISGTHGGEWFSIEVIRRVVEQTDPGELRGTILAIPVANPVALEHFSRMTPDESDEPDMNRVWPGGTTWVAEQMAGALSREVIQQSDYLIDYHPGPWGACLATIGYPQDVPDPAVAQRSLELAVAFGYPSIRALKVMGAFPGPRSIAGYAGSKLGVPNLGSCLGGSGFAPEVEEGWVTANVRGVFNVMRHVGMLTGELEGRPERFFHFESRGVRVVPTRAGMLQPTVGPEALLTEVTRGTVLGRVVSPYTFEVIEELVTPIDGVLFGVGRAYPVRPGDWAFFVSEVDNRGSRWVPAIGSVEEIAAAARSH
jgi:predicted deacylase